MSATIEHMTTQQAHMTTQQALMARLQRRWVALLRRANAREAAARRALAHARTVESARRSELAVLQERARGLEEIVFNYAINRRPLRGHTLGEAVAKPHLALPAHTPTPPAPFDPVALVAAMLPLTEPQTPPAPTPVEELAMSGEGHSADSTDSEASSGYWFPRAFRRLVAEDAREAGRLLLQLLPAQGLVWPEDVAYTLNVAETGFLSVTVSGDTTTVQPLLSLNLAQAPALRTDLAGLARTVTARRGWGRIGARVSGTRGTLRPLRALACAPLSLRDLERQGIYLDPALLRRLQALDAAAPTEAVMAA
ncbi:MAG TPA: hypothetical protein VGY76_09285 [Solirubrobacteraceae bacterium]|jgi:hypothetical protein|nr:hypothetical protein [Solirubrobacteraceae bacterium]